MAVNGEATASEPQIVRQFSSSEDAEAADRAIAMLSQALSSDVLVAYFTRGDPAVSAAVWDGQLRGAARVNPAAQQFFSLRDGAAAAFVMEYPRDSPKTWSSLLRMMPTVPLGKWRALAEWVRSKDLQKAAFARAHGSFWYLLALADAQGRCDSEECGQVLAAVSRAADAAGVTLYVEARPRARAWLRGRGFNDVMGYRVRKSEKAPQIYVMARPPGPTLPAAAVTAGGFWSPRWGRAGAGMVPWAACACNQRKNGKEGRGADPPASPQG